MELLHYYIGIALWYVLAPSHLLIILLTVGGLLLWFKRPLGLPLVSGVTFCFFVIAFSPIEHWLLAPLEQRIKPPRSLTHIDSIIVLGGGQRVLQSKQYPYSGLGQHTGRVISAIDLAKKLNVPVIFVGGSKQVDGQWYAEAESIKLIARLANFSPDKLIINSRSNDTYDNAQITKSMTTQLQFNHSLLITSAGHMPRALGVFTKQKITVTPYPVEYQLTNHGQWFSAFSLTRKLYLIEYASHEWLGLLKYYILGMSDSFFPEKIEENPENLPEVHYH